MKNKFYLPAAVWIVIVTVLLVLPGSAFPKEDWLSKIGFDKWVHTGLYAVMAFLLCYAIYKSKGVVLKNFALIAMAALSHGIVMEFIQKFFVPNRSFDGGDIMADAAGALLGCFIAWQRAKKIDPCGNRGRNQN